MLGSKMNKLSETKGNQFIKLEYEQLLIEPKIELSDTSKKIIELEYGYAKDNALASVNQRGSMMQVYLAFVAIIVGASTTLIKDENDFLKHKEVALFLCVLVVVSSIYMMRGMLLLRSDWYDFCQYMATLKVFTLKAETLEIRKQIANKAYYHDPFHIPSRHLRTNFFYLSYALCTVILFFSAVLSVVCADIIYEGADSISLRYIDSWRISVGLTVLTLVAVVAANRSWVAILRAKRHARDSSPRIVAD